MVGADAAVEVGREEHRKDHRGQPSVAKRRSVGVGCTHHTSIDETTMCPRLDAKTDILYSSYYRDGG